LNRKPGSDFTALFEALVIDWLKEASVATVSRQLGLSWNEIDRIKMIKARSRGFRNKERFRNAIYFHLGGLDRYPIGTKQ
jgi:hypothetical protein